jgi:hypothetical protein
MHSRPWITACCTAALVAAAGSSHAFGVSDPVGDFLPTYTGAHGGDLDVVGAFVTYNPVSDLVVLSGTCAADNGTTPGAFYIFGIDRGAGTAQFAANGITGVKFDSVVRFNQNGSVVVNRLPPIGTDTTTLAAGTAQSFGSTIIGVVSGSLLPSLGLAKADYTWNLWPRATFAAGGGLVGGFAAISDFAPNNSNVPTLEVSAVPEPGTTVLLAGGLAVLALVARRRRAA